MILIVVVRLVVVVAGLMGFFSISPITIKLYLPCFKLNGKSTTKFIWIFIVGAALQVVQGFEEKIIIIILMVFAKKELLLQFLRI